MMKETAFSDAVEKLRAKWGQRVGGLLLADFLIKPIQRICKYPLLFKALIGFTAEDHSDMALLRRAEQAMQKAAEEVNAARASQKQMQDMQVVNDNMEGYPNGSLLVPGRLLLRAGGLVKLSPTGDHQERHFFLFNDMVLYAVKKKGKYLYKDHVELFELSVRPANAAERAKGLSVKEVDTAFELVRQDSKKKKVYTIIADTKALRDGWMKSLNDAISARLNRKDTDDNDAVLKLESTLRSTGRRPTTTDPSSVPYEVTRTKTKFFGSGGGGKGSRFGDKSTGVSQEELAELQESSAASDVAVLNAIKAVRAQVADTHKLLAQAQSLQSQLSEKVEVMQRMVDLEEQARMDLERRIADVERKNGITPSEPVVRSPRLAGRSFTAKTMSENDVLRGVVLGRSPASASSLSSTAEIPVSEIPKSPRDNTTGEIHSREMDEIAMGSPNSRSLRDSSTGSASPPPGKGRPQVSPRPSPQPRPPPRSSGPSAVPAPREVAGVAAQEPLSKSLPARSLPVVGGSGSGSAETTPTMTRAKIARPAGSTSRPPGTAPKAPPKKPLPPVVVKGAARPASSPARTPAGGEGVIDEDMEEDDPNEHEDTGEN